MAVPYGAGTLQSVADVVIVAGTPTQGPNFPVLNGVMVCANPDNGGIVAVGGSGVSITGNKRSMTLAAGGMPNFIFRVSNTNQLYFDGTLSGDIVGIMAV